MILSQIPIITGSQNHKQGRRRVLIPVKKNLPSQFDILDTTIDEENDGFTQPTLDNNEFFYDLKKLDLLSTKQELAPTIVKDEDEGNFL